MVDANSYDLILTNPSTAEMVEAFSKAALLSHNYYNSIALILTDGWWEHTMGSFLTIETFILAYLNRAQGKYDIIIPNPFQNIVGDFPIALLFLLNNAESIFIPDKYKDDFITVVTKCISERNTDEEENNWWVSKEFMKEILDETFIATLNAKISDI